MVYAGLASVLAASVVFRMSEGTRIQTVGNPHNPDDWKHEYCRMVAVDAGACSQYVAREEEHCDSLKDKHVFVQNNNGRCKKFRQARDKIQASIQEFTDQLAAKYACTSNTGRPWGSYYESSFNSLASCGYLCDRDPECKAFDYTEDASSGHPEFHKGKLWVHDACRLFKDTRTSAWRGGGKNERRFCVQVTGSVRKVAQLCEPDVHRVCREASCPTYARITHKLDEHTCNEVCDQVTTSMWGTGELHCDDEDFDDCTGRLHSKLRIAGRVPELEALVRDHLLKCICINRLDNAEFCSAEPGQKWCQFDGTPSWKRLLSQSSSNDQIVEPTCEDKLLA